MMQEIRNLKNRVMMAFARGVLRSVNDAGGRQVLQAEFLKGELRDGVEYMQHYGFTSHPHAGADVAVAFLAGNREQGIAVAVGDRRYRLKALQTGEVALYDDLGNKVQLLRDMVKIEAVQHLEATAPTTKLISDVTIEGSLTVNGNMATTGTITNNGKDIGSGHTHKDVQPGSGNTGVPN